MPAAAGEVSEDAAAEIEMLRGLLRRALESGVDFCGNGYYHVEKAGDLGREIRDYLARVAR